MLQPKSSLAVPFCVPLHASIVHPACLLPASSRSRQRQKLSQLASTVTHAYFLLVWMIFLLQQLLVRVAPEPSRDEEVREQQQYALEPVTAAILHA